MLTGNRFSENSYGSYALYQCYGQIKSVIYKRNADYKYKIYR